MNEIPMHDGNPAIMTYTGALFDLVAPTADMVRIEDIAHATSQLCRFTGHTQHYYSVAQHCVLVSYLVKGKPRLKFAGLMHDAQEAYVNDIASPLKRCLPGYKKMENVIERVITEKYGLRFPMPQAVKDADRKALALEAKKFMLLPWKDFGEPPTRLSEAVKMCMTVGLDPRAAEQLFLGRFNELSGGQA
jgi:5'-deoxynucleotidase YfbR-like HD superfamily hydrolase